MNKKLKKILCCGVCLAMATVFTAGCTKTSDSSRPFVMAIGATDGVFSPFFATAQYDTQVTELTQISMLSADKNGNITYGENEPCVVLDMASKAYDDKDGKVESQSGGNPDGKTVYEFVIKNGIKFSDGKPLTIKDVLFNLYVYLDPVYFGSSTVYSTDIIGLTAYRTQDPEADENSDITSTFQATAQSRINYLMDYLKDGTTVNGETTEEKLLADIEVLKKLYLEEVTSDWTTSYGTLDSYEKEYSFTEDWEVYYFNEYLISILYDRNENGSRVEQKDDNGKYLTSLDEKNNTLRAEMESAKKDAKLLAEAKAKYKCSDEEAVEHVVRETAIKTVYNAKAGSYTGLRSIFTQGWATASNLLDKFAKEEMSAHYDKIREENKGALAVPNISGIKAIKSNESISFKNKYSGYDILQVQINGVDPKAVWNMAFQVAPAHYYSGVYKGTDYRNIDIAKNQFGVCFGDPDFFDNILNATEKSKCPVGAGVYQAATVSGEATTDGDKFHPGNKYSYYVRNNYFETVGSGISNAKIKYVRYREVGDANLVTVLKSGEVDYGEPSCTDKNVKLLAGDDAKVSLGSQMPIASGYGYVGINPKYIPDYEVRVAIMRSMNIMLTVGYYTRQYASPIYRPMSKANWLYSEYIEDHLIDEAINNGYYTDETNPESTYYFEQYYPYEETPSVIWNELAKAGWRKNEKTGIGEKDGRTLKYTFTIAGGNEDHPAFEMFTESAKILNQAGFEITVMTSTDALKQLATGSLAVWAAAYTSPVDPDLYQVYHKDSKATSVKNWGYDSIKQNSDKLYNYELPLLNDLSKLIIEARQSESHADRGPIYNQALDIIMKMAIQLPTYQRQDLVVYNSDVLDTNSLNKNPTAYAGVLNRIWEVNYK